MTSTRYSTQGSNRPASRAIDAAAVALDNRAPSTAATKGRRDENSTPSARRSHNPRFCRRAIVASNDRGARARFRPPGGLANPYRLRDEQVQEPRHDDNAEDIAGEVLKAHRLDDKSVIANRRRASRSPESRHKSRRSCRRWPLGRFWRHRNFSRGASHFGQRQSARISAKATPGSIRQTGAPSAGS